MELINNILTDRKMLFWLSFIIIFFVVLFIDVCARNKRTEEMKSKTALKWSALWVCVALLYGIAILLWYPNGEIRGPEFIAGYLTEYSLSIDNLFVFIMIFKIMKVAPAQQPRLLLIGILFSIVLRIIFAVVGLALIQQFAFVLYIFGAILVWTAWKMAFTNENEEANPEDGVVYKFAKKVLPITNDAPKNALTTRVNGKFYFTGLFLVAIAIGSADIIFAVDSVPAIMGISQYPFIVISSNVFACLGLVSLFFALKAVIDRFYYIKYGVSFILFFIGLKMIFAWATPIEHFFKSNSWVGLSVIVLTLVISVVVSLLFPKKEIHNSK